MSGLQRLIRFFAANALFASGLGFHAFLYNFYLEGLGHSPVEMGRAAATWSFGGLLVLLPVGRSVDKWGPKPVIVLAAVLAGMGLAWGAFATSTLPIYLASALAGAAGVSWRVAQAPVLMELSTAQNRSRLFTLDAALLVAAGAGATAMSGAFVERIASGWHMGRTSALSITLVIGALLTAASAFAYSTLELSPKTAGANAPATGTSVIPSTAILLIALTGLWLAGLTLASPFFNLYFAHTFHLPIARVSWIFSAATVTTAILLTGAGEVATRIGARPALVIWLALFAPAMWGLALAPTVGLAAACYLMQSIVSPAANPLLDQLLLESVPPERRGVVSSWRQAMASAGQVLAQSLGGVVLAATSFTALFAVAGGLGLAAGCAVAIVAWRLGRTQ